MTRRPMDTVTYMKALELRLPDMPRDMDYTTEPDEKAIANLERLQAERPLKPPVRR